MLAFFRMHGIFSDMFKKKDDGVAVPFAVAAFRVLHGVLFCHAAAILGITFFWNGTSGVLFTPERIFALAVASPMLLGSFFFWLVMTARVLFCFGIFACLLPAFVFAMLPFMMNVLFPEHLFLFGLAAIYALSGIMLIRKYFLTQPIQKTKWDAHKR